MVSNIDRFYLNIFILIIHEKTHKNKNILKIHLNLCSLFLF